MKKNVLSKELLTLAVGLLVGCATQSLTPPAKAANFISEQLVRGTNLVCYIGTADTATTFTVSSTTYNTNRTYTDIAGNTGIIPSSTNSTTGALVPVPVKNAPVWSDANGNPSSAALSLRFTASGYTNTATVITLWRSVDGQFFDKTQNTFAVTVDAVNDTTIITNLPTAFTTGARYIGIWKIDTGANPPDNGTFTLRGAAINGYVP